MSEAGEHPSHSTTGPKSTTISVHEIDTPEVNPEKQVNSKEQVIFQDGNIEVEAVKVTEKVETDRPDDGSEAEAERTVEAQEPEDDKVGGIEVVEADFEPTPEISRIMKDIGEVTTRLIDALEDSIEGSVEEKSFGELVDEIKTELNRLAEAVQKVKQSGHASHGHVAGKMQTVVRQYYLARRVHRMMRGEDPDALAEDPGEQDALDEYAAVLGIDTDGNPFTVEYSIALLMNKAGQASPHTYRDAQRIISRAFAHWKAERSETEEIGPPLELAA